MSSKDQNLSTYMKADIPDGSNMTIGIVVADWNREVTSSLLDGCLKTLETHNVPSDRIHTIHVPGSFELPQGARILLSRHRKIDAIICLGCVIKGETSHNEYINQAVATGLTQLGLTSGKPCIFGVLTPNDMAQAVARAGGKHGNKGVEAAQTALRMAHLTNMEGFPSHKIGFGF